MRQEGDTQVLVTHIVTDETNPSIGMPIESGARGELIAINSVTYIPPDIFAAPHLTIFSALSSNPEHEANPPASIAEFMESKALYAKYVFMSNAPVTSPEMGFTNRLLPSIHHMYGLLRPRRQIWVLYAVFMKGADIWFGLELNYRPVKVDDVTLSEYNHRYGLYKRT